MLTFNQWCGGKRIDPHFRLALQAIWEALPPEQRRKLFDEMFDAMPMEAADVAF